MNKKISLKEKSVSGIIWSTIERFSTQSIQFVIEILMARMLLPSDYGKIGMLAILLAVSRTFIDSGFTNALIQKKNRTEIDFSTVFYFNIVIALALYALIYLTAPLIASFYQIQDLTAIARIISLTLVISSFSSINRTKLVIKVDFKTQAKISFISAVFSGSIGIYLAYNSFGVWALVWQSIINLMIQTLLFYYFVKWKPIFFFSINSFKELFSFGSKLLISNLLSTLYENLYTIVIGKKFKAVELGYYAKADQLVKFPSSNLTFIVTRVSFPVLSSIQDDDERLFLAYKKYLSLSSYLFFPLMVGLATLANPLILILFTAKWEAMVILFQIMCFDWIWDPMCKVNINLLLVKGHSNLILRLEIFKRILSITILIVSIPFGLYWICIGRAFYSFISVYINSYYTEKIIRNLNFISQIKLISPYLILSLSMGIVVFSVTTFLNSIILKLIIGTLTGILFYISSSYVFKITALMDIIEITSYYQKKKKNS